MEESTQKWPRQFHVTRMEMQQNRRVLQVKKKKKKKKPTLLGYLEEQSVHVRY